MLTLSERAGVTNREILISLTTLCMCVRKIKPHLMKRSDYSDYTVASGTVIYIPFSVTLAAQVYSFGMDVNRLFHGRSQVLKIHTAWWLLC